MALNLTVHLVIHTENRNDFFCLILVQSLTHSYRRVVAAKNSIIFKIQVILSSK